MISFAGQVALVTGAARGPGFAYATPVVDGVAAYSTVKMAVVGLTNILAREGAAHGSLINAISPVAETRMWGVDGELEELRPDAVAPGAAVLVSDACRDSGWVARASNGQFHATRASEADSVDYPRDLRAMASATPEAVGLARDRIPPATREARAGA